jgi:hypothetical protein
MPSSIGSVNQLVTIIRRRLAEQVGPSESQHKRASKALGTQQGQTKSLESLVSGRIRQIHPDDPKKGRKAFRIFLESILLSRFGEHLINDAKFHKLVDDIQDTMEADPATAQLIDKAIAHLLTVNESRAPDAPDSSL